MKVTIQVLQRSLFYYIVLVFTFACSSPKDHKLVIINTNLIDVRTGNVIPDQTIAIDGDTISAIYQKGFSFSDSTEVIDGSGKYLIPGLWDMHVHHNWNYKDTNPLLIANGITGVREMWGNMYLHDKIKKGIAAGSMNVPDVYTGSVIIDGKPPYWPGSYGVASAEEARKVALEQIGSGVDFLKVYSGLSKEAFDAIAEVCKERGIPFAGHVPESITIQYAAKKGMVSAEHFYGMLFGSTSKQDSLLKQSATESKVIDLLIDTFSQEKFDSLCHMLKEEALWLSPTIVTNRGYSHRYDPEFTSDSRTAYMAEYMMGGWYPDSSSFNNTAVMKRIETYKREFNFLKSRVGEMHRKGVKFLAGSDYPNPFSFPGFSLHDEIELYVEGGMDNLSALQTATLNPAIFMGKEAHYGDIAVGKKASLVLLDKNPLDTIGNTRAINTVVLRGKSFKKPELNKMLEELKQKLKTPTYGYWLKSSIELNGIDIALDSLGILLGSPEESYRLEKSDLNMLGYQLLQEGQVKNALKVLQKNTQLFPDEYNVYDSYGEVLLIDGQLQKAKENYKKATQMNPYYGNGKVMLDSIDNLISQTVN